MKLTVTLFALMLSLLSVNSSAKPNGPIYQKVYSLSDEEKVKELVLETYKEALKSNNQLQAAVEKIEKEVIDSSDVENPIESDMLLIHQGKGSAAEYSFTYLVGTPVVKQGSANLRRYDLYVRAQVYLDYMAVTTTVVLETIVDLKDRK